MSLVSEPSPVFPGAWLLIVLNGFPAIQAVFNVMSPLRGSDAEPVSSEVANCFLRAYPNLDFRNPVGDGLPSGFLFRSYLGGIYGHYPPASDCDDTPGSEPYRKLRGIYAERNLVPSCRSQNHLVISMHKRKHKRSCCQLLFLVSWIYGTTTIRPTCLQ